MTVATLQTLRDEEHLNQFWEWLMNAKKEVDLDEPELPRLWKQPRHFEIDTSGPSFLTMSRRCIGRCSLRHSTSSSTPFSTDSISQVSKSIAIYKISWLKPYEVSHGRSASQRSLGFMKMTWMLVSRGFTWKPSVQPIRTRAARPQPLTLRITSLVLILTSGSSSVKS